MKFFKTPEHVYVGETQYGNLVFFNTKKDKFFALSVNGSELYLALLNSEFYTVKKGKGATLKLLQYRNDATALNSLFREFITSGLLKSSRERGHVKIAKAESLGGLTSINWQSNSTYRISQTRIKLIFLALYYRVRVNRWLKHKCLEEIFTSIKNWQQKLIPDNHFEYHNIKRISEAIDIVCLFYPRQTKCLAWALTASMMLLSLGCECRLVIGIITHPFMSHAWIEVDGKVLNDRQELTTKTIKLIIIERGVDQCP